MIDGLFKRHIDPLWEKAAAPLIRLQMTPNQVTATGLALVALAAGAYLLHRSSLVLGLTLAVAFAFDALDGAVARQRDMRSKAGGYFDAMVDRYQELVVLAAIAHVAGLWPAAFFAFAGGVLTSYAKARTAVEIKIDNDAWPDLFERLERIIFLCALLIVDGMAAAAGLGSSYILATGLAIYALLANFTAIQRTRRAFHMLKAPTDGGK
ncbi:CDP-alcohol phosphatidyltransferase family protein [Stappia sp. F7233]|uniref:CDP-alcohol phosphatidyltransferase family protein n=1 Tax=Stappia albiluteola TaxID=2758565 RepID=A0A839AGD6_9HYPH|nr:CDP-alcohol phosphatidyltransferase family protein [Stappia albiluteola]MBA5778731.1 CDP-alcohol phosphatidyltransferase family protein [Stappia albiluteola]